MDGVCLEVGAGEVVALVGKSGSGKSVLLSLPPRLYDPEKGGVYLDGIDVRELRLEELRKAICLASDEAVLFRDTIAANIALGMPEASRTEIEEVARLAQAHQFIMEMPDQYESIIGERGLTLSGGQRQRVALARADPSRVAGAVAGRCFVLTGSSYRGRGVAGTDRRRSRADAADRNPTSAHRSACRQGGFAGSGTDSGGGE